MSKQRESSDAWLGPSSAPAFNARVHSAVTVSAIVDEVRIRGIDPFRVLEGTGISPAELSNYDCLVSYRQLEIVIRNALRLSIEPQLAFSAGSQVRVTSYGMYGYAMLSSHTLAEVVELTNKYILIGAPCCSASLVRSGERVLCSLSPVYWHIESSDIYRFAVEFALAAHQKVIRDLLGPAFAFSKVVLRYERPKHSESYLHIFGPRVEYSQAENGYEFDAHFLTQPLPFADPRSNDMVRKICKGILSEIEDVFDMTTAVRRILIESLRHMPSLGDVAKSLNMNPRALRRSLASEGTSYREILSSIRVELACSYLRETDMTNEDIAHRLGFSDAANFRHSFKRSTGVPPSDYRRTATDGSALAGVH